MPKEYSKTIKLSIANMAAKIIMEEGVNDYQYAKKKAVKYLDYNKLDILPSNDDIDRALVEYGAIYQKQVDISTIHKIKKEALKIMQLFDKFNPFFLSQITEGLVPKYPIININIFTDNMKEVEYVLLNNNINFEIKDYNISEKTTKKKSQRKIPIISIEDHFFPVKLKILDAHDLRLGKKNVMNMKGLDLKNLKDFNPNAFLAKS